MQAIVLVGGEGTRLRPLTERVPKPALTLVDRPFLAYMIEWLAGHGVTEVVLACGFLPDVLRAALSGEEERAGVRIRYVAEPEPLGTAGAIRFAADALGDELDERFLALNGDVLTDLDLSALLRAHRGLGRGGDDRPAPCRGLLGLWLGPERRRRRGPRVPREDGGAQAGRGQRGDVRAAALRARSDSRPVRTSRSSATCSRAWSATGCMACSSTATGSTSARQSATDRRVGTSSKAAWRPGSSPPARASWSTPARGSTAAAQIGPQAVIGPGCQIGPGARILGSVVLDGCTVGENARVVDSILSPRAEVPAGAVVEGAVAAEGERLPS